MDEIQRVLLGLIDIRGKTGLTLSFNDHSSSYYTAKEAVEYDWYDWMDWISEEEKALALGGNSVWTVQWYPRTPISFEAYGASSLSALIDFVKGLKNA